MIEQLISAEKITQLAATFQNNNKIIIIPHINPDGDGLGSALGLYHVLKNQNIDVQVICPNEIPNYLKWLPSSELVNIFSEKTDYCKQLLTNSDVIVFVDFNSLGRIPEIKDIIQTSDKQKVMIDHHPYPDEIADITFSHPQFSSTCELMVNIIEQIGHSNFMDTNAATCFYTGIMTDTGALSYNSSHPEIYQTVAKLLGCNIDKERIHLNIFHSNKESKLRLMGFALSHKMVVLPKFKTAYISLSAAELLKYNYQAGDTEGLVNMPLSIDGIEITALFQEKKEGTKLSFRSHEHWPVNHLSEKLFGGGGHTNAAGGESKYSLKQTIDIFEKELPNFIKTNLK